MRTSELETVSQTIVSKISEHLDAVETCIEGLVDAIPQTSGIDDPWMSSSQENPPTGQANSEAQSVLQQKARQHMGQAEVSIDRAARMMAQLDAPLERAQANAGGSSFGRAPGYGALVQDAGSSFTNEAATLGSIVQHLAVAIHDGRSRISDAERRLAAIESGQWPPDPMPQQKHGFHRVDLAPKPPANTGILKHRLESRLDATARRFSVPTKKTGRRPT